MSSAQRRYPYNFSTERDSVTRFLTIFGLKDSTWAPSEQTKRFCKLFRFRKDIRSKNVWKLSVFVVIDYADTPFFLDMKVFIFLNYCYWVCKHTLIIFFPDCSFKSCENPSKFSESVGVVFFLYV